MLSLFLELRARLPNVIIGAITRESMRRALATGIKGRQVLDFLKWHAHPVVRRRSPVVPENIADQVQYSTQHTRTMGRVGIFFSLNCLWLAGLLNLSRKTHATEERAPLFFLGFLA